MPRSVRPVFVEGGKKDNISSKIAVEVERGGFVREICETVNKRISIDILLNNFNNNFN